MLVRAEALAGELPRIDQLSNARLDWPRGFGQYTIGSRFLDFIRDQYGLGALRDLSHDFGSRAIPFALNFSADRVLGSTYLRLYDEYSASELGRAQEVQAAVRAGGETSTVPQGRRVALHHMITAGDRGYAAWRDGGFTIHDISDPTRPKLLSHITWSPPFPGGTHTPLPLAGRNLAVVADEANAERCAKGMFHTFVLDVRAPENPVPISTLPTPKDRDYCGLGTFGPHNLHENRPGSFRSEDTIFATYNIAGVRVFDIKDQFAPKEIAYWVPPAPTRLIDPRPNTALAAKSADIYVATDGLLYVSDWNAGLNVLQYEG